MIRAELGGRTLSLRNTVKPALIMVICTWHGLLIFRWLKSKETDYCPLWLPGQELWNESELYASPAQSISQQEISFNQCIKTPPSTQPAVLKQWKTSGTAGFNHAVQKSYTFPLNIKLTFSTFHSLSLAMTQYGWAIYHIVYHIRVYIYSLKCMHYIVPSKTSTMDSAHRHVLYLPHANPVSSFVNILHKFCLQSQRSKENIKYWHLRSQIHRIYPFNFFT